jgi:dethiobiotin synthetase
MTPDALDLRAGGLFVAGTDTGVGKTWCAVRVIRALASGGRRVAAMKPVAAGAVETGAGLRNDDALQLAAAANVDAPYELVNSVCLPLATSPHLAAAAAGVAITTRPIVEAHAKLAALADLVIVEGAGGWYSPIGRPGDDGPTGTMQDVAVALRLPVLLVVGLRLGCLSHALLTAHAVQMSGLDLAGWIANPVDPAFGEGEAFTRALEERLPAPRVMLPAELSPS